MLSVWLGLRLMAMCVLGSSSLCLSLSALLLSYIYLDDMTVAMHLLFCKGAAVHCFLYVLCSMCCIAAVIGGYLLVLLFRDVHVIAADTKDSTAHYHVSM